MRAQRIAPPMMSDPADGFVAPPGGIGTYEELFEVRTWAQLGFHAKPVALLNVEGFNAPLAGFLDHATAEGFVRAPHRAMLLVEESPTVPVDRMLAHQAPIVEKWLDRGST